jgi:hypothetical protein
MFVFEASWQAVELVGLWGQELQWNLVCHSRVNCSVSVMMILSRHIVWLGKQKRKIVVLKRSA